MFRKPYRILIVTVAALAPLASGCASKGYVREQIDALRAEDRARFEAMEGDLARLGNSTEDALERARTAGDSAEEARAIALGNAGLEEVDRYTVYFAFDSADLDGGATETLTRAADSIRLHPEVIVDVYGFADPRGSDRYNLALGQRRADEVVRYLAGAAPNQLSRYAAVSFGERDLAGMAPESGENDRMRRVVVSLIRRIPLEDNGGTTASRLP